MSFGVTPELGTVRGTARETHHRVARSGEVAAAELHAERLPGEREYAGRAQGQVEFEVHASCRGECAPRGSVAADMTSAEHRLGVAWLDPTSVDPEVFVDRSKEREKFLYVLEDLLKGRKVQATLGVGGRRGVGKSIFVRWCLRELANRHREKVIAVTVDMRLVNYAEFLKRFAKELAASAREVFDRLHTLATNAPQNPPLPAEMVSELKRWVEELDLLARSDTVTEAQAQQFARQYGTGATLKGSLFEVLEASNSFTWQETRQSTTTTTRTVQITSALVQEAVELTLRKIYQWSEVMVVVFFDDVDQLNVDDLSTAVANVLKVPDCVRIVHLRDEAAAGNIRREISHGTIPLRPMPTQVLCEMLEARASLASPEDKAHFRTPFVQSVVTRLAAATGSPLVLLRWLSGFAVADLFRELDGELPWNHADTLALVVADVLATAADPKLLRRVANAVDKEVYRTADPIPLDQLQAKLGDADLREARRLELVGPMDRDHDGAHYWIDPRLALLHDQIADALRV